MVNKNFALKCFVLLLVATSFLYSNDVKISASVDKTQINKDDLITFSVKIDGTTDFPNIPFPSSDDFVIVSGPSQSSSVQIINGVVTASRTISWRLAPTKTGKLQIPSISVKYNKKIYETEPINITVLDKSEEHYSQEKEGAQELAPPAKDKSSDLPEVFLKATPSKDTVYRGEEVDVKYELYYKNVRTFSREKLPDSEGFWMEEFPTRRNPVVTSEVVNGKIYRKAEIQRIAFFPMTTGKLTISPMVVNCEVIVPRQKPRSFFDDFFDDSIFGSTKVVTVKSEPIEITVKPLPDGAPSNFSGSVGRFSIKGMIDTLETRQNQALTLLYEIKGMGNINALKFPTLELPSAIEVFEPKIERKVNNTGEAIQGVVSCEYVIIPRVSGNFSIPALSFCYFDPTEEKYRNITAPSFSITVRPEEDQFMSQVAGLKKEEVSLLGKDIRFISRVNHSWRKIGSSVFSNFWFWFGNGLALLVVFSAIGFHFWKEKMQTDVLYTRRKKAWNRAEEELNSASRNLALGNIKDFISSLDKAIKRFILDRLGLPRYEISPSEVRSKLEGNGVDGEIISKTVSLLVDLEEAKFSPNSVQGKEYSHYLERTKNTVSELSKVI